MNDGEEGQDHRAARICNQRQEGRPPRPLLLYFAAVLRCILALAAVLHLQSGKIGGAKINATPDKKIILNLRFGVVPTTSLPREGQAGVKC